MRLEISTHLFEPRQYTEEVVPFMIKPNKFFPKSPQCSQADVKAIAQKTIRRENTIVISQCVTD